MLTLDLGFIRNFYRMSFIYKELCVLKQLSLFVKFIMEPLVCNNPNPESVYFFDVPVLFLVNHCFGYGSIQWNPSRHKTQLVLRCRGQGGVEAGVDYD